MTEYFEMSLVSDDLEMVEMAVNQGIDSRLEGFTRSKFEWNPTPYCLRLECKIHPDEIQVLIRRLVESGDCHAEDLADSIVYVLYDKEM
jgi:hypothetical protein